MSLSPPGFPAGQGTLHFPGVFPAPSPTEGDTPHPSQHPDPSWGPFCTLPDWGVPVDNSPLHSTHLWGLFCTFPVCGGPCDTPSSLPAPSWGLFCTFPVYGHPCDTFPPSQPFPRVSSVPSPKGVSLCPRLPPHQTTLPLHGVSSPPFPGGFPGPPLPQTGFQQSLS